MRCGEGLDATALPAELRSPTIQDVADLEQAEAVLDALFQAASVEDFETALTFFLAAPN